MIRHPKSHRVDLRDLSVRRIGADLRSDLQQLLRDRIVDRSAQPVGRGGPCLHLTAPWTTPENGGGRARRPVRVAIEEETGQTQELLVQVGFVVSTNVTNGPVARVTVGDQEDLVVRNRMTSRPRACLHKDPVGSERY